MQMSTIDRTPPSGCRRVVMDRRVNEKPAKFPLIDSNGIYVVSDRRRIPDRRVSGIVVSWGVNIDLDD